MKRINTIVHIKRLFTLFFCASLFGCDDFVKIDPPRNELTQETVFADDATAEAAMRDIYYALKRSGFASGGPGSISLLTSLSSDEQNYYSFASVETYMQFNDNELQPDNTYVTTLWSDMYRTIFKANSVLEGLAASAGVSQPVRDRLAGEAKFVRAFCYFYLVNLWGGVPIVLTTNYHENNKALRAPVEEVYELIMLDLQDAIVALPEDYAVSKGERVRANKWVATALLARVYLYRERWADAEQTSSVLIENGALYALEYDLVNVFRTTSPEAILQLWSDAYPPDATTFAVYSFGPVFGAMRPEYVGTYEENDQRWAVWGRVVEADGVTYPCYFKYLDTSIPPKDYTTVFRLSEQYLIRAEARLRQLKFAEAAEDIDVIRDRAGLPPTASSSEDELFDDVVNERKAEFATEWGHRWFDLKRWNMTDEVLAPIKPGWSPTDELFPIPEIQIINNPGTEPNPG